MAEAFGSKLMNQAPDLADVAAFVTWARNFRGPKHVETRRDAEDRARQLLDARAGAMTRDDAQQLGREFNTDSRDGEVRHDRFTPAFVGATLQKVTDDLETFNRQVAKLWDKSEDVATETLDDILKHPDAFPGAGRSLTSVIFYLRNPARFVPWLKSTHIGLGALTGFKGQQRQGGAKAYLAYCESARVFADKYELEAQEIDGVLALVGNLSGQQKRAKQETPVKPVLPADAFAFLSDLRDNNTHAWMDANQDRYHSSLRDPFRDIMQHVADRYITDLDPKLNTKIKTGDVLASIRKRFPDAGGEYHPYYWGAFSRGRKQEDVQLYVRIDVDSFRVGVSMSAASSEQVEQFKFRAKRDVEALWQLLEPVRARLTFRLEDAVPPKTVGIVGPTDLAKWLDGTNPAVLESFAPNDPLVTSDGLVDEIGLVLTTLYPLAALAWGESLADSATADDATEDGAELASYTLSQLAEDTLLPIEDLEEWAMMLAQPHKRQAIFFGPPGTGKTFVATKLAQYLASPTGEVQVVQFHPSFSYEDFLEGLRPDETSDEFRYTVRPGIFADFCERARKKPDSTFAFVIDEVNRADLGSVFGELMMLLEYRGEKLTLPYSQRPFSIPKNVVVLATMNTADRSLALVDFALRRRFHTIEMPPSREVLVGHLARTQDDFEVAVRMFDLLQKEVDSPEIAPGHSYWMGDDVTADGLRRVWRYELRPYLAEYWFEHRSRLEALEKAVGELVGEEA